MLHTPRSYRGMVTAPHHLASEAGLRVLRDGGSAIAAMVAMAATLPVVYPHMTAIGGDAFWLVSVPGNPVVAIDACGAAGTNATLETYAKAGLSSIPWHGPLAANTVAGTVSGWGEALRLDAEIGKTLPLARLLEDAIWHAENGFAVTKSQAMAMAAPRQRDLPGVPGFAETFLLDGALPKEGQRQKLPRLARTLGRIADKGSQDFYTGALARDIARDLAAIGSPVTAADLARHTATRREPLSVKVRAGTLYNFPPPTQGLASLMILALFDRFGVTEADGFDYLHGLVEATKQAYLVRDRIVGDPGQMTDDAEP